MKTATLRDLRNDFSKLEAWLNEGEEIHIERRGVPVAILLPPGTPMKQREFTMPDFKARRRAIWGDRVFSEDEIKSMREAEFEDEEG